MCLFILYDKNAKFSQANSKSFDINANIMENTDHKRFSTFLLASGQRLKIIPPNETNWNLIMLNYISGIKPNSIINLIETPDSANPIKNTFMTFNENEPDTRIMNFRLNNKLPFQCYLYKKKSYVHFVFSSNSNEKLIVEQANQEFVSVGLSINPNFPNIFMNEIQRIVKSEHPLTLMSSFIKGYEIRPYFHVHPASFIQLLSDSINFSLIQMSEKVISSEIPHYINFLDLQFVLGEELLLHDAIIIEKIINLFPRLKPKMNHVIIHTKNFVVFACLLMQKDIFDYSLLCHHLNFPDKIDIMISFRLLKIIVDEQVPICSSILKIFLPYVKSPLLHMLLSSNKILFDSTVIPKQISNITLPSKKKIAIDHIVNFDFNLIEAKVPEKNTVEKKATEKNVANFRPQKLTDLKKPQLLIKPDRIFEISPKKSKQLKIVRHNHIFLKEKNNIQHTLSLSSNIEDYSYNSKTKVRRERSSGQYNESIIIGCCALFTLITLIFIWTHFSFYVL